ncbi:MAG: PqqD family protein [Clostridia bacterium]|nr:PqqD family protein [Clostridia bacterium]
MEKGHKEDGKHYQASKDYILREIADESMLIPSGDLPGNKLIMLNDSGAFLWKALQTPKTMEDVINMARESYEDPDGMLEAHIQDFLKEKMSTGHIWEVE